MKKLRIFTLLLIFLLSVSLLCGCNNTETASNLEGNWYSDTGRKLELNADGTFFLEGETGSGVWRETATGLHCTDSHGEFDATASEENRALNFGPYGTFYAESEETAQLLSSKKRVPFHETGSFHEGYAVVKWKRDGITEHGLIDEQGNLVLTFPAEGNAYSIEVLTIQNDKILFRYKLQNPASTEVVLAEFPSGKKIAGTGDFTDYYGYSEKGISVSKYDRKTYTTYYGCIAWDGTMATEWTALSEIKMTEGGEIIGSRSEEGGNGWIRYDRTWRREEGSLNALYFLNPQTEKTFLIVADTTPSVFPLSDGSFLCKGPVRYADSWEKIPQELPYEQFRILPNGSVQEELSPVDFDGISDGMYVNSAGLGENDKTILTDFESKKSVTLDLPTYKQSVTFVGNYGLVTYSTENDTLYSAIIDRSGNVLRDRIVRRYDGDNTITVTLTEYGYVELYNIHNIYWSGVSTPEGEILVHGAKYPCVRAAAENLFQYNKTYINQDGRVLIDCICIPVAQ